MHRITRPDDRAATLLDGACQRRETLFNAFGAEARDQGNATRLVRRVERINEAQQLIGFHARTALDADRVFDALAEIDMGVIDLTRAVANPEHMGRRVVPVSGRGIDTGHRFFVAEKQRFVAGVEFDLRHLRHAVRRHTARRHEVH